MRAEPQPLTDHTDFSERFRQACDDADVPPLNYGRLRWIQQSLESYQIKVTPETVRRWLKGTAKPRDKFQKSLAQLLKVDAGWLFSGPPTSASEGFREMPTPFKPAQSAQTGSGAPPTTPMPKGDPDFLERIRARLGGTVTIMPGVDLTEPTGEVWDAESQ